MESKRQQQLPTALKRAFRHGHAAIFVGAGASVEAGMPTWQQLAIQLARDLAPSEVQDFAASFRFLSAIPQYYENEHGRQALTTRLRELIPPSKKPSRIHTLLAQLPCRLYYTTNFDILLESALTENGRLCDVLVGEDGARENPGRDRCQVRKIHGSIERPSSLVLTRTDFARYERLSPILFDQLKIDLAAHPFLFVGYSVSDPDFNSVYDDFIARYAPFNRHHFITVFDIDDHERRDLESRGLSLIDLNKWGSEPADSLRNFLSALCESTSEALHIRRFFRGLDGGATVPIVIPSELDQEELTVMYHAMDSHVGVAIDRALAILGQSSAIYPDKQVISDAESLIAENLILVGSPSGNLLTRWVFERAQKEPAWRNCPITPRFEFPEKGRILTDPVARFTYKSPNPSLRTAEGQHRTAKEYALLARFPNPWSVDKWIFVFAGLWGMGTHAVGDFLHNLENYQRLPWQQERAIAVLEASYRVFDPYHPTYEPRLILHTD